MEIWNGELPDMGAVADELGLDNDRTTFSGGYFNSIPVDLGGDQIFWTSNLGNYPECRLLHTTCAALTIFLHNVTLLDVWTAFYTFLSVVAFSIPKALWSWIKRFNTTSYDSMVALFGVVGWLAWWVSAGVVRLIIYIPRKCWTIIQSIWSCVAAGAHEAWVWINPKGVDMFTWPTSHIAFIRNIIDMAK